jgi:hypothetical protein
MSTRSTNHQLLGKISIVQHGHNPAKLPTATVRISTQSGLHDAFNSSTSQYLRCDVENKTSFWGFLRALLLLLPPACSAPAGAPAPWSDTPPDVPAVAVDDVAPAGFPAAVPHATVVLPCLCSDDDNE